MNTVLLNTVNLDGGKFIIKGNGGGGGVTINNQEKVVDITENGTTEVVADAGFTGLGKVVVNTNVASSGGGTTIVSPKDVNFRDYDGTILHSYTKEEFLKLTELPELPTQEGLICQEWNWDIEDAKSYVQEYGVLEVGATYITDDGKTRLYVTLDAGRTTLPLYFNQSISNGVIIDWGDGSSAQTRSGTTDSSITHQYSKEGSYCITLSPIEDCTLKLIGSSSKSLMGNADFYSQTIYLKSLKKVEIGVRVEIKDYAFNQCNALSSIVIPNGVTSIGASAFYYCNALSSIVIPNGVTSIGASAFSSCSLPSIIIPNSVLTLGDYLFSNCRSLSSVVIGNSVAKIESKTFNNCKSLLSVVFGNGNTTISSSLFSGCSALSSAIIGNGVTTIESSLFSGCSALSSAIIGNGVTSIGASAFYYCNALSSIVIPNGVTSIGDNAFDYCNALSSIVIPNGVTSIGASAFSNCNALVSVEIGDEVTSIGNYAFYNCHALSSVKLGKMVTSIGDSAFGYCNSISSIIFPHGVDSIGNNAFDYCSGVKVFDFRSLTSVPALSNSKAFPGNSYDYSIVVPDELYDSWKSATNWSSKAGYIVKASEFNG